MILFDTPLLWPFRRLTQRAVSSQISSGFFSALYIVFTAPCSPDERTNKGNIRYSYTTFETFPDTDGLRKEENGRKPGS